MRFAKISAAFLSAFAAAGTLSAGVFGFEDISASSLPSSTKDLQADAYTTGSYGTFVTYSDGVKASLEYMYYYNSDTYESYWAGGAVSNQTANTGSGQDNDLRSKPGGASSGSNFGVLYLPVSDPATWQPYKLSGDPDWGDSYSTGQYDGYPNLTSLIFDQNVMLDSIDIALTSYDYEELMNGSLTTGLLNPDDPYDAASNPYHSLQTDEGSFYVARIYALLDADGTLGEYVDLCLAKNEGGTITISQDWNTVDLSSLNAEGGVYGIGFQLISSFSNNWGMTMPGYLAIDDVVFNVPEPADYAALFGAIALAAAFGRRKLKK